MAADARPRRATLGLLALLGSLAVLAAGCGTGGAPQVSSSTSTPKAPASTATSTTVPPTTTTTMPPPPEGVAAGNPWPPVGAVAPGHHAILVMGDSIAGQVVWSLPTILAFRGIDATVYSGTIAATGLLDPMQGLPAPEYFAQQLAAHPDVDTVVFEWAGACKSCAPNGPVVYSSPEYFQRWQATAHDLMRAAKARGLHVIWAISPPPPVPTDPNDTDFALKTQTATVLAWADRSYAASERGVVSADWWEALSDTAGRWQSALWYDGALHVVRADDLVHLTPDGSVRGSAWTIRALEEAWSR